MGLSEIKKGGASELVEASSEVVTAGQDWAGVTYIDPDAIGANPTAKIYPDGSIVGSTDNGSYTKYPNGDLQIHRRITLSATIMYFPMSFIDLAYSTTAISIRGGSVAQSTVVIRIDDDINQTTTSTAFRSYISSNGTTPQASISDVTLIGRWK